jgi:lipopolysaccharide transport system permease protein
LGSSSGAIDIHVTRRLCALRGARRRLVYLRDLLLELVVRDIRLRYNRSFLGIAWSLVIPLAQMLVFYFVFRTVLAIDIPNYHLFVFCGLLAWTWFQSSLVAAAGAITENRELVRRPGFPTSLLPVIPLITHLVHFLLALPILLLFELLSGGRLTGALLLLPVVIGVQLILTLSLADLIATFQVTFRDTRHLIGILLLLLFYLSPVIYDPRSVPDAYQPFYRLNPMVHLVDAYRAIFLRGEVPDCLALLVLGLLSAGVLWFTHAFFVQASYRFAEEL